MLGASYLFSFTLQHSLFFGFMLFFIGEMVILKDSGEVQKRFGLHVTMVGLSILNLSFLKYSFSEELLLMQVLLLCIICSLFLTVNGVDGSNERAGRAPGEGVIYFLLLFFLIVELVV